MHAPLSSSSLYPTTQRHHGWKILVSPASLCLCRLLFDKNLCSKACCALCTLASVARRVTVPFGGRHTNPGVPAGVRANICCIRERLLYTADLDAFAESNTPARQFSERRGHGGRQCGHSLLPCPFLFVCLVCVICVIATFNRSCAICWHVGCLERTTSRCSMLQSLGICTYVTPACRGVQSGMHWRLRTLLYVALQKCLATSRLGFMRVRGSCPFLKR